MVESFGDVFPIVDFEEVPDRAIHKLSVDIWRRGHTDGYHDNGWAVQVVHDVVDEPVVDGIGATSLGHIIDFFRCISNESNAGSIPHPDHTLEIPIGPRVVCEDAEIVILSIRIRLVGGAEE